MTKQKTPSSEEKNAAACGMLDALPAMNGEAREYYKNQQIK